LLRVIRSVRRTTVHREQAPTPILSPRSRASRHFSTSFASCWATADTIGHRAAAPGFAAIAACFGTANLTLIVARLHRGLLRAAALERVLLARAASGRDLSPTLIPSCPRRVLNQQVGWEPSAIGRPAQETECAAPHAPTRAPYPAGSCPDAATTHARALTHSLGPDDPANFHTPTLEQLEAQVRRRPLGRTIVDICLDLAVVPGLCTGAFWNDLFDVARCHGGSIARLVQERWHREQAFSREQETHPTPGQNNWSNQGRAAIRQVLGFFIGEDPVAPAAAATGPP
jgi:hypothetical protein